MKWEWLTSALLLALVANSDGDGCAAGCAPSWNLPQATIGSLSRLTGESVSFQCRAFGYPRPSISWTKDGHVLKPDNDEVVFGRDSVGLSKLEPSDTGKYTCLVVNKFGRLQRSIHLSVYESKEIWRKENLTPSNVTSRVGETVKLMCDVETDHVDTTVTWAKGADEERIVLKTRFYKGYDQLVLYNVSLNDSGRYACIFNTSLTTFERPVWLTILESPGNSPRTGAIQEEGAGGPTTPFLAYLETVGIVVGALVAITVCVVLIVSAVTLYRSWRKLKGDNRGAKRLREETVNL